MNTDKATSPPSRTWAILAIMGVLSRAAILMFVVVTQLVATSAVPDWELRAKAGDVVGLLLALGLGGGVGFSLFSGLFAALAFVVWLHGAVRHAHSYEMPHPNATPWGAVACWFIPFVNLIRPYTVVQSLYRVSQAQAQASQIRGDFVGRWRGLLPIWWAAWLPGTILTNIYYRLWSGIHVTVGVAWLGVAAGALLLLAAACAAAVVWSIQALQESAFSSDVHGGDADFREFRPPGF